MKTIETTVFGYSWNAIKSAQNGGRLTAILPPMAGRITPSQYEKNEWSRMAKDAYSKGKNDIGHKFSMAATLSNGESCPLKWFDDLQSEYRSWLIDGFSNQ